MSANSSRAIVVSTPSALPLPSGTLPVAQVNVSNSAGLPVDAEWADCVPLEKRGVPLSVDELNEFRKSEGLVEIARSASLTAGKALASIRDLHLYREHFHFFKDYCAERWGFARSHSNRLIAAAQVVAWLSQIGDIFLPECEWQVRAITAARLTKEQAISAWIRGIELADHKEPTAKHVQKAVLEVKPPKHVPRMKPKRRKELSLDSQTTNKPGLGLVDKAEMCVRHGNPELLLKLLLEMKEEFSRLYESTPIHK
jgi:hypothetical protein